MSLLFRFKVSGHSMEPFLKPGQEILVSSLPYLISKPKIGDVVAFRDNQTFIVKRIKDTGIDKYLMAGDNANDSKDYGWITRERIVGKLIYRLRSEGIKTPS